MLIRQPVKDFIDMKAISDLVHLLAGENTKAITGSSFVLDGGWTAQ